MRKLLSILFLLSSLVSYSQVMMRDAQGKVFYFKDENTTAKVSAPEQTNLFSVDGITVCGDNSTLLDNIAAYYPLEEASGSAINSAGSVDLTLNGQGSGIIQDTTGKVDSCYYFPNSGSLGWNENNFKFGGSFTVACWVKTTASGSYDGIISNYKTGYGYDLGLYSDGRVSWACRSSASSAVTYSTTTINDGNWHHIAGTYNTATDEVKVFVDGINEDTDYCTNVEYGSYIWFTVGGRWNNDRYFNGFIDEVYIAQQALTDVEVVNLKAHGDDGISYPFSADVCCYDTMRMQTLGYDPSIDSIVIVRKYDGYSTSPSNGVIQFAFPVEDTALYHDTLFYYDGLQGVPVYWTMCVHKSGYGWLSTVRDTAIADSPTIFHPDTLGVFEVEEWDLDSGYIKTALQFDPEADSFRFNIDTVLPHSWLSPISILASSDSNDFKDLIFYVPNVPGENTMYYARLWSWKQDEWTPEPNVDTFLVSPSPRPDTLQYEEISYISGSASVEHELQEGLFGLWTLDESSGNAIDEIGNHDLVKSGTVTQGQTGKLDDCYQFTSSGNGYLGGIDTDYEFLNESFSVAAWVKTTASGVFDGIICNYYYTGYGWDLGAYQNTAYWDLRRDGGTFLTLEGSTTLNDGNWHLVVGTYNAADDSAKLYIDDGTFENSGTHAGPNYHAGNLFTVGSRNTTSNYMEGYIDQPCVWKGVELSQDNVDSLWQSGAGKYWPWATGEVGEDSIRYQSLGYDAVNGDTVRVVWSYEDYPQFEFSDSLLYAFPIEDTSLYHDTTGVWPDYREVDTTVHIRVFTGNSAGVFTTQGDIDTVYIDSSGTGAPYTPPEEEGTYDIYFEEDFEQHSGSAPTVYDYTKFSSDWGALYRHMDHRPPGWPWLPDSLIVDPETGSISLLQQYTGSCQNCDGGYDCVTCSNRCPNGQCGQGNYRGGGWWKKEIGYELKEAYYSYNVRFRSGWVPVEGGKLPGFRGGSPIVQPECCYPPDYGEGFSINCMWTRWSGLQLYSYFQNQSYPTYAESDPIDRWQPTGPGLAYNSEGRFIFDFDSEDWYNITYRVVCNTFNGSDPNYDGFVEVFVNGYLLDRREGMYLITLPDIAKGFNSIIPGSFYGGASNYHAPQRDEWIVFDDFYVWLYHESVTGIPRDNEFSPQGRVITPPGAK